MKSSFTLFLVLYFLAGFATEFSGEEINMENIQRSNELFLIASTVVLEAEGESYKGKLGVAYVIMNRVRGRRKSVTDVVFDPYDFSAWNTRGGRQLDLDQIKDGPWFDSEKAAASAYYEIEKDPTHGADHYLNIRVTKMIRGGTLPSWVYSLTQTVVIGRHTFFKEG